MEFTLAFDLRRLAQHMAPGTLSMLLSVLLHASVAAPVIIWNWPDPSAIGEDVEDGPLGDGLIGEGVTPAVTALQTPMGPVQVALYTPPPPADAPPVDDAPEPPPEAPEADPVSAPPPRQQTPPTPAPAPSNAPPADTEVADPGQPDNSGVTGQRAPAGDRQPCEEVTEVKQVSDVSWRVNRDIIDYYASHLRQLDRQAGTATARGREGVPIGVRVYLPRCSVLRSVGLRNKDIILSINERPVSTLPQAITTWLALRNETNITVQIRRKGVGQITHTYRIVH